MFHHHLLLRLLRGGLTLQGDLQEVLHVLGHVQLGLLQAGDGPAVVEVSLVDGDGQVVVDEVRGRGEVQVPLEGLQQQQLHVQQALLGHHQVHGAHAAQAVQGLQLGDAVLPLLEFTCNERQEGLSVPGGGGGSLGVDLLARRRQESETT